jgi:hypothetical protein
MSGVIGNSDGECLIESRKLKQARPEAEVVDLLHTHKHACYSLIAIDKAIYEKPYQKLKN